MIPYEKYVYDKSRCVIPDSLKPVKNERTEVIEYSLSYDAQWFKKTPLLFEMTK